MSRLSPGLGGVMPNPDVRPGDGDVRSAVYDFDPSPHITTALIRRWIELEEEECISWIDQGEVLKLIKTISVGVPTLHTSEMALTWDVIRESTGAIILRLNADTVEDVKNLKILCGSRDNAWYEAHHPRHFPPAVELTIGCNVSLPGRPPEPGFLFDEGVKSYTEIHNGDEENYYVLAPISAECSELDTVVLKNATETAMRGMIEAVEDILFPDDQGGEVTDGTLALEAAAATPTTFLHCLEDIAKYATPENDEWTLALSVTSRTPIGSVTMEDYNYARLDTIAAIVVMGVRFTSLDLSLALDLNDFDLDRVTSSCPNLVKLGLRNLGVHTPIVETRGPYEIKEDEAVYEYQRSPDHPEGSAVDLAFEQRVTDGGIIAALAKLERLTEVDLGLDGRFESWEDAIRLITESTLETIRRGGTVLVWIENRDVEWRTAASPGYGGSIPGATPEPYDGGTPEPPDGGTPEPPDGEVSPWYNNKPLDSFDGYASPYLDHSAEAAAATLEYYDGGGATSEPYDSGTPEPPDGGMSPWYDSGTPEPPDDSDDAHPKKKPRTTTTAALIYV